MHEHEASGVCLHTLYFQNDTYEDFSVNFLEVKTLEMIRILYSSIMMTN